ncbi:phenylacetate--CoA ligase family protein [Desulfomarina sp.]
MNQNSPYSLEQALALRRAPRHEIEERQLHLLKKHLERARRIPFYRELLGQDEQAGVSLENVADLSQLPFTCRDDLDRHPEQFGPADGDNIRDIALTSGTTGEPVIIPYSEADLNRLAFNEAVAFYGAGVRKGDRVLLTVTLDRCFIAGVAYYSGITFLGARAIRSGPGQPARQWHIIEKLNPGVIVGVPSFLKEIGEWGVEKGLAVADSSIHTVVTIGESVRRPDHSLTALGEQVERLWGAKVRSSYGATEFETAFCECVRSCGGHVHPELMLVEIVDDAGHSLPDGTAGEVVVTPLGVEGFPLVRFRTGDIARLESSPCSCGWNTKRLGPVEGRLAQRLKYRGTTFYPETVFHVLQEDDRIRGAYVEVSTGDDGGDDVTVVVGCDAEVSRKSIEESLQAALRVRPTVKIRRSGEVVAKMFESGGRKPKKFFDYR